MFLLGTTKILFFTTPRYLKLPYHCYQKFQLTVLVCPCLFASHDDSGLCASCAKKGLTKYIVPHDHCEIIFSSYPQLLQIMWPQFPFVRLLRFSFIVTVRSVMPVLESKLNPYIFFDMPVLCPLVMSLSFQNPVFVS